MVDIGDAIGNGIMRVLDGLDWLCGECFRGYAEQTTLERNSAIIAMFLLFIIIILDFLRVGRKWRKKLTGDSEFWMWRLYWLAIPIWLFVFAVLMSTVCMLTLLYLKWSGAPYYPPQ